MFNRRLTLEWLSQKSEIAPGLVRLLAAEFKMDAPAFIESVGRGEIRYLTVMWKILSKWVCMSFMVKITRVLRIVR